MEKHTILIVDDHKVNRKILCKLLEEEYQILQAEDGVQALEILKKEVRNISAVLLDIVMPVLDGYGVLTAMQKDPELSRIPVIVSSQKDGDEAEIRALSLGAQDFIAKPYKGEIIRHRLENTIRFRETAAIANRAEKDELTGLLNKQFFLIRMKDIIRENPEKEYDIICFDIERFKLLNDAYGELTCDRLLKYFASLIQNYPEFIISSRFTADHFYVLMERPHRDMREVFHNQLLKLNEFPIEMKINVSCGIYQILDIQDSIVGMCDRAKLASGINRNHASDFYSYYDDTIRKKMMEEQFVIGAMDEGIAKHQFQVYYQPKYVLHTEMIAGAEALVRWIHPEKGFLSPGSFIPVFEKNGFITQLDRYVWEQTCKDIRNWMDQGYPPVPISVNVSRTDIFNPNLSEILLGLLHKYQIPIAYLHLEITESAYTDNPEQIVAVVENLHNLGFVIEMDDFGSGYSSLNMLAELPVDILKLDMRFVQSESTNPSGKGIMSFVISLAKWMKLSVIAEGVETADQITSLRSMDCNYVQGFYFAKPMEEKVFAEILQTEAVSELKDTSSETVDTDSEQESNLAKRVMVIVDDIEVNRAVLESIFSTEYKIKQFENGRLAWDYLQEHYLEVEAILTDLLMPEMDGFQLLHLLQTDDRMQNIPVIVTSQGDVTAEERALDSGADDFISKPYNPQVVYHRVHNMINMYGIQNAQILKLDEARKKEEVLLHAVHTKTSEKTENVLIEQNRYRYILDNLDVAYFELDEDKRFYASDKYSLYAMSNESPENIWKSDGTHGTVYPEDLPLLFEFFKLKRDNLPNISTVLRLKMQDGTYRWTEMMGFFEYNAEGECIKAIGVLRDVDKEWLNQNRKLQYALNEAEKANQAKTDFLARVSHDMRTPLNGILGLTSLMEGKRAGDDISKDLEQLKQSSQYLLNLINDTLDVSMIEHKKMILHPSVCDGKIALQTAIEMIRPRIEAKRIHFRMQASDLPFTKLYIDVGRVEQAVVNILSNAVRFTKRGGHIDFIMKNLDQKDGVITDCIIIRDDGVGMSEEFLPHIFEPFAQERNDSKSIYKGTGLGMTIAKQCIEQMGGTISVKSKINEGTEVTITLPMTVATKAQYEEWEKTKNEENTKFLKGKRILLCEDHPLNAEIAIRLLEKYHMIVEHAENGQVGVSMFQSSPQSYYDAILMDIRMPVMNGLEATRAIRKLHRKDAERIPIIAMTANAMSEDVKNAINAGMTEHLGKPVDPNKLFQTLTDAMTDPNPYAGKKVLVVDDIEMNRMFVRKAIGNTYQVLEAANGEQAFELLKKDRDIVAMVTDIQMPGMDGKELIRKVRSDASLDQLAILANTIYGDHRQEEELLYLGANDFVYKPTSARIIIMRLEHILRNM